MKTTFLSPDEKRIYAIAYIDALHEAAEMANAQVDLPQDEIPNTSLKSLEYFIGIRRGNVNAANAILSRINQLEKDK